VQRVLTVTSLKERIGKLAVGLAADCDAAEEAVEQMFRTNLPDASTLPFVALLTPDGRWIEGASGAQDSTALSLMLGRAEQSPLLDAAAAVRKQLEKPAAAATAAAAKGDWNPVLAAAREARKSTGRCPERTAIADAEKQARTWAEAQLAAAVASAAAGGDLAPLRKQLAAVKQHFAGEPEAADAENGAKALQRLQTVREVEAGGNPARDLRERSAAPWKGTRWEAVFAKPPVAPSPK
jgi:hypothetical protein